MNELENQVGRSHKPRAHRVSRRELLGGMAAGMAAWARVVRRSRAESGNSTAAWARTVKIGLHQAGWDPRSPRELFTAARELGYDGVELAPPWLEKYHDMDEVYHLLVAAGTKLAPAAYVGGGELRDPAAREAYLRKARKNARWIKAHGGRYVTYGTVSGVGARRTDQERKTIGEAFGRVADVALSEGCTPLYHKGQRIDQRVALLKHISSDYVGACVDTGNSFALLDDPMGAIEALPLQAGLDVYLEKPLTVTIAEGRHLAELVKKTGRVLQVGSQQRTMEINRFACEFIRGGGLGKVTRVELPNYPGPLRVANFPAEPIPEGLDWNLFCGPTKLRPHNRKLWVKDAFKVGPLLWRGWDLWRDYSGHRMTNWGAHSVDMVQYALGRDDTGPVAIRAIQPESVHPLWEMWKHKTPAPLASGQRRFWPVVMRYADNVEIRFIHGPDAIDFHSERGRLRMRRNQFETDPADLVTDPPDPKLADKWKGRGNVARPHLENWLDCIRTRGTPNAPVETGHRSVTICHLANIARELNHPLEWNPATEQFVADDKANALLDRPRRRGYELG